MVPPLLKVNIESFIKKSKKQNALIKHKETEAFQKKQEADVSRINKLNRI